jgi:hypothetical protein
LKKDLYPLIIGRLFIAKIHPDLANRQALRFEERRSIKRETQKPSPPERKKEECNFGHWNLEFTPY